MPGIVNRKRPSVAPSEDDEQSDASSAASNGSKRARLDRDASEQNGGNESSRSRLGRSLYMPNGRSEEDENDNIEDEFQPGSIVRVALRNFVTYTAAEFHPGPSLNMVIGPNGTGKSTLVCAICLGLGWETKNLGRAKDIGEFVKHGSAKASIEIELAAAKPDQANPVIRREITKEGNKSKWYIGNHTATQKEVVKLAKSFAIQIDNLCQFLPQDRVVEFARLEPVALLKETMRAAAPEQMVTWFEELKSLRADDKKFEQHHASEEQNLAQLRKKQDDTREDVELWERRQALDSKSKALESCRPLIECNIIKRRLSNVKAQRNAARAELQQLQNEVAPTQQALNDMEDYTRQIDVVRNQRKLLLEKSKQFADRLDANMKKEQENITTLAAEYQNEKNGEKTRRADRKRTENAIAEIDRKMQEQPVEWDEEEFKTKRVELRGQIRHVNTRNEEVRAGQQQLAQQAQDIKKARDAKRAERQGLDTQQGQQNSLLNAMSMDTAKAWSWIEKNRSTLNFKGEVHGPPLLTCTVPNPDLAVIVESQLKPSDVTAITCTHPDDARLLSSKLLGRDGLGLHQISIRNVPQPLSFYRSPLTDGELHECGFDGWIKDHIQGPDPVLAMLCDQVQLHRAPFTRGQLTDAQYQYVTNTALTNWIAGGQKYRISRRQEYGQQSTSVISVPNQARFFAGTVDIEKKQRLEDELRELQRDTQKIHEDHNRLKDEQSQLKQESESLEAEIATITQDRNARKKAWDEFNALPMKRATKVEELDGMKEHMRQTESRLLQIKLKSEAAALKVADIVVEYAKAGSRLRQVQEDLLVAELRLIEATSDFETLTQENLDMLQTIEDKKRAISELEKQKSDLGRQYNTLVRQINAMTVELSDEENDILHRYSACDTLETLEEEIESVTTQLGMLGEGNVNTVRQYQDRIQQIQKAEDKLVELASELEATKARIKEIRDQWEPKLDDLIAQVSEGFAHNFSQIGCAGQVGVYKDENDFDRWSIQIQVRFREGETMSILDSQRQSGGERAVSTIFYLMALQDFARAPFRVVDEINQGMDPRNERMVHERMVDIACRERTSQYFLITPKLLNDLKYHPKMRIHCINSGEGLPSNKDLDWQKLAARALEVRSRA